MLCNMLKSRWCSHCPDVKLLKIDLRSLLWQKNIKFHQSSFAYRRIGNAKTGSERNISLRFFTSLLLRCFSDDCGGVVGGQPGHHVCLYVPVVRKSTKAKHKGILCQRIQLYKAEFYERRTEHEVKLRESCHAMETEK